MSSSEPPKKKQKQNEFPSQPTELSFKSSAKFAKESQKVLNSIDFTLPFLQLPLLSANPIQSNFNIS